MHNNKPYHGTNAMNPVDVRKQIAKARKDDPTAVEAQVVHGDAVAEDAVVDEPEIKTDSETETTDEG